MNKVKESESKAYTLELIDGKCCMVINAPVTGCTFKVINRVDLCDLELDTFTKRLKWLITGRLS